MINNISRRYQRFYRLMDTCFRRYEGKGRYEVKGWYEAKGWYDVKVQYEVAETVYVSTASIISVNADIHRKNAVSAVTTILWFNHELGCPDY